jgi:hypothetical protein
MNLASFIILGVVLVLVLYYFLYTNGATVLSNKLDLAITQPDVPIASLGLGPDSKRYSIEMWMYVYNANSTDTYIVSRDAATETTAATTVGNVTTPAVYNKNIGIKLIGGTPKLVLEYQKGDGKSTKGELVITDNFPLQTWAHLIVSIDNRFIDVYMNGKLIKSMQDNIQAPSATSVLKYGVCNCYLAKLVRSTNPTDPQTAWNQYVAGNGENPLAKYLASFGLSVTLQKNSQDYSKITVF